MDCGLKRKKTRMDADERRKGGFELDKIDRRDKIGQIYASFHFR